MHSIESRDQVKKQRMKKILFAIIIILGLSILTKFLGVIATMPNGTYHGAKENFFFEVAFIDDHSARITIQEDGRIHSQIDCFWKVADGYVVLHATASPEEDSMRFVYHAFTDQLVMQDLELKKVK